MTAGPEGTAGSASAPSLEQFAADMFGDLPEPGETPEPESTSAAGEPPAEPAIGTEDDATAPEGQEGTDAAEREGDAPSDAAEPAPDAAAPEVDPFADTAPLTYVVDGQTRTSDDIRVFKEGGAVIRPEALPNIQKRLSERDHLFEQNREHYKTQQSFEAVTRWVTTDAEGKEQIVTGPQAAVEMRVANASLLAENTAIVKAITDPAWLKANLVLDGDTLRINPASLEHLVTQIELQEMKAGQAIRDHFAKQLTDLSKPAPEPTDYTAAAPQLIADVAKARNLDASVLSPESKQFLAEQLADFTKDGKVGIGWQKLVAREIAQATSQKQALASTAKSTKTAKQINDARLAAAGRGVKPTPKAVTPMKRQPVQDERAKNEADAFELMERSQAAAMRRRA